MDVRLCVLAKVCQLVEKGPYRPTATDPVELAKELRLGLQAGKARLCRMVRKAALQPI